MRRVRHEYDDDSPDERGGADRDWDLSEGLDPEGPSAEDLHQFGSELDECPNCKSTIYDQSEMCPECGWYLGEVEKTVSLWVILGVVGLIAVLLLWVM